MKRLLCLLLAAMLLLSGCGAAPDPIPTSSTLRPLTAAELLDDLLAAVPEGAESPEIVTEDDETAFLMLYGVDSEILKDCAIARLGGARAFELAVIDLNQPSTSAEEGLLDYLWHRLASFIGYAPEQANIVEHSRLFSSENGCRLILAITEKPDAVRTALIQNGSVQIEEVENPRIWENQVPSSPEPEPEPTPSPSPEPSAAPSAEPTEEPTPEPSPEPSAEPSAEPSENPSPEPTFTLPPGWRRYIPPNTDDMSIYDTSAVLAAWEAGSDDGLNRKDKELYNACCKLISERIHEDMTDYEKEWAIYSWLVSCVQYDWSINDPTQTTPRDSFRPYGALVNRKAVCLGYATAFQLLMDMLEVECITVVGAAFHSTGDHAWNMVRLNGEWYCVDATWDLGRGASPASCGYFNVTSDYMARTDHQWDYENVPMATATDGGQP